MGLYNIFFLASLAFFSVTISIIEGTPKHSFRDKMILCLSIFLGFSVPLVKNEHLTASLHPQMTKTKEGTKASLACRVTPEGNYDIVWTFKGGKIQAKATLDKLQRTVTIPFVTLKDAGTYACIITDSLGKTKMATTILNVIGKLVYKGWTLH